METNKSFTDVNQSKKLAEILPLESADMYYSHEFVNSAGDYYKLNIAPEGYFDNEESSGSDIPAWSIAALLGVLPKEMVYDKHIVFLELHAWENSLEYVNNSDYTLCVTESYDTPVDACVAMIEKLHELNLL